MQVTKEVRNREVVTTVEEEVIVLELSKEEAHALQAVLGSIKGHSNENNLRVHMSPLYQALKAAGIDYWCPETSKYANNIRTSMTVSEYGAYDDF